MAKYDYGGGCPCGLQYECDPGCRNYTPKIKEYIIVAKTPTELNDDFDFGFSVVDESELEVSKQASDTSAKLQKMYKMVLPLLNNLAKNPEKDYIHWPNRIKKIEEFKKKLQEIADS